ncbi:MAG: hypothetical protein ACK54X_19510 [Burkholderiales bacterium]|jgi:hypothetical protein
MSLENEALQRCERLLTLMSEAIAMERASGEAASGADAHSRSLLRPLLEDALARLESLPMHSPPLSLQEWVRELVDLEFELDRLFARRGWRVIATDAGPPLLTDRY